MAVTDYLQGDGSQANPYIIHNAAAWKQFFTVDKSKALYFEVVSDIDLGGETLTGVNGFHGFLNGNGFTVSSFKCSESNWFNTASSGYTNKLESIRIVAEYTGAYYPLGFYGNYYMLAAVDVLLDIYIPSGKSFCYEPDGKGCSLSNVILNVRGPGRFASASRVMTGGSSVYVVATSSAVVNASGFISLIGTNGFLPANYPTLSLTKWILDGVSLPRPVKNSRPELTQTFAIKGKTSVGGVGKKRRVRVLTAAYLGLLNDLESSSDGDYLINMGDVFDPVVVLHHDVYGFPFVASKQYSLGDVIHPKIPNGYAYDCTTSGVSSSTEPTTWPTSGSLTTGAAIFTPRPIYKPESHLVQPVKIDLLTGLPA